MVCLQKENIILTPAASLNSHNMFPFLKCIFRIFLSLQAITLLVVTAAGRQQQVHGGSKKSESRIEEGLKILLEILRGHILLL